MIGLLSPLFLLALFLGVFRGDWRCIWIPIIPAAATVVAAGALAIICNSLQLFVLGLGGSILGLAVDQGIHIYIACREPNPLPRLVRLARPLALGAGTSIAVFLLLIFTRSPALRQLGLLAGCALALSLIASFLLMPTLAATKPGNALEMPSAPKARPPEKIMRLTWALVAIATALAFLPRTETSFRVEALDGIPDAVLHDENAYRKAWQPSSPNLLLLRDPDGTLTAKLHQALDACRPISPNSFWPDQTTRKNYLEAWKNAPLDSWETMLDNAAKNHGLPSGLFRSFFENLRQNLTNPATTPPEWFAQAYRQLRRNGISVFFLENPQGAEETLAKGDFDAAILSPEALRTILTRDFGKQLKAMAVTAGIVIILLTFIMLRSFKKLLLALLPVLLTLHWLKALFALFGHPVTLMTAIGGVLLIGLAIDYGIFAVQWLDEGPGSTIPRAMLLSATTTVFTAAVLLFSRHPVLFDLGLVLSCGITLAYLVARFILPAFAHLHFSKRT